MVGGSCSHLDRSHHPRSGVSVPTFRHPGNPCFPGKLKIPRSFSEMTLRATVDLVVKKLFEDLEIDWAMLKGPKRPEPSVSDANLPPARPASIESIKLDDLASTEKTPCPLPGGNSEKSPPGLRGKPPRFSPHGSIRSFEPEEGPRTYFASSSVPRYLRPAAWRTRTEPMPCTASI